MHDLAQNGALAAPLTCCFSLSLLLHLMSACHLLASDKTNLSKLPIETRARSYHAGASFKNNEHSPSTEMFDLHYSGCRVLLETSIFFWSRVQRWFALNTIDHPSSIGQCVQSLSDHQKMMSLKESFHLTQVILVICEEQ